MVWIAFAFMTAGAVLCIVWPLMRTRSGTPDAALTDAGFYRQQMAELDGDVARGVLASAEAEGSRAELGRRLIAAVERTRAVAAGGVSGPTCRLVAAIVAMAFVPLASLALYGNIGSPGRADEPLAERLAPPDDVARAIARIETHLATSPDDARGYEVIAPVYAQMGRFSEAAKAYANVIRLLGSTAGRESDYGQALVMAADGVVTAAARHAFDAALASDPRLPEARFYVGLAAEQDGDKARARETWGGLVAEAAPDAPWLGLVRSRLAALDGVSPPAMGAAAEGIAALPSEQRSAAIHGMVDGLAARLAQNGRDADGWLRLVRAYKVLGETDKARQALGDARRALGADAGGLARLGDLAHELGLDG